MSPSTPPAVVPDTELERFEREALPFLGRLYATATHMTGDRPAAERLVEQTCLRALHAFGAFTDTSRLKVWLFRILADTALRPCGDRQSSHARVLAYDEPTTGRREKPPVVPARHTPQAQALNHLSCHDVKAALGQLPRESALVVHLADVEEFSRTEIAEILGVSPGTAAARLHHARRRLLGLLTDAAHRHGVLD
ncbi:RNA polymerase sigma factor [Streptomyces sp. NPDC050743]|uniref:RNA polymerase sigma factor n=1 Tax=Streptomyces sp. NPDC050743 TaxID=3365634 RepID=UPI0037A6586F